MCNLSVFRFFGHLDLKWVITATKSSEWNNMANLQCSAHARHFASCLCEITLIGPYEQVFLVDRGPTAFFFWSGKISSRVSFCPLESWSFSSLVANIEIPPYAETPSKILPVCSCSCKSDFLYNEFSGLSPHCTSYLKLSETHASHNNVTVNSLPKRFLLFSCI